jgi:hypothetical protein
VITSECRACGATVTARGSRARVYCSMPCKAKAQRDDKPVTEAWLRAKYLDEGLDTSQIALLVDRDPKSVWSWLKGWGIPTRGRGTNPAVHFKKGEPSAWKGRHHSEETKAKLREDRKRSPNLPHLVGGVHWLRRVPKSANPRWKGGITPERQAFNASQEWRSAVRAVWQRANAHCERCGLDHRTLTREQRGSFHVHHIVGFEVRELRAEVSNLALLCRPCHLFVHSRKNTAREFLR